MRNSLNIALTNLLMVLMSVMVLSTLLQVFARLINLSVPFTEELTIYAMMWVTLFGSAYAFGLKKHIAIDALTSILKGSLKWKLEVVVELIVAVFATLILIVGGSWFTYITFRLGQLSRVIQIPKGWVYLALPITGLIILAYTMLNIRETISNSKEL